MEKLLATCTMPFSTLPPDAWTLLVKFREPPGSTALLEEDIYDCYEFSESDERAESEIFTVYDPVVEESSEEEEEEAPLCRFCCEICNPAKEEDEKTEEEKNKDCETAVCSFCGAKPYGPSRLCWECLYAKWNVSEEEDEENDEDEEEECDTAVCSFCDARPYGPCQRCDKLACADCGYWHMASMIEPKGTWLCSECLDAY